MRDHYCNNCERTMKINHSVNARADALEVEVADLKEKLKVFEGPRFTSAGAHIKALQKSLAKSEEGRIEIASLLVSRIEQVEMLRETIAEVIRNSHDIIAKKRCSKAIAKLDGLQE